MTEKKHSNLLINETSPYLLQHSHNPVNWYPWGPEALERSRREDKPLLLSIGYSACHWCHVMEHESFENEEIAQLMNERFIPIKVDREERPDLDDIYMNAVQLMTGSGGWPLTVFLTPELKPFYGGTYFPPEDRWGRPGFKTLLLEVDRAYREQRAQVNASAEGLTEQLRNVARLPRSSELLSEHLIRGAVRELAVRFDRHQGGFTPAPKFPPSTSISLLLRHHRAHQDPDVLHMVELTLERMAAGGIYDHLGGGFHRYSTDDRWLVPHFEKMLYDNALLASSYLEAFQVTGKPGYARVAGETLDFAVREMQGTEGGYFSSQDADSEGVEGKFYLWSLGEVQNILGDKSETFCRFYGVAASGNWEGKNILHSPRALEDVAGELGTSQEELTALLEEGRRLLMEARAERIRPGLDDKILTSWNGLMIAAMSRGYRVLGQRRYLAAARKPLSAWVP
ncbi:MAG: thioredoxin domain-containing protein, partial [Acidobacteriota bacterium]